MKNIFVYFAVMFVFCLSSCNIQDEQSESLSTNPFAYVGQLHNEGLAYVLEYIKSNQENTRSSSGSEIMDSYMLINAGVSAFMKDRNLAIETKAQTRAVRNVQGIITDAETGEPIIGAQVFVIGTSIGTTSDVDGKYSINTPDTDCLMFSHLGYHMKLYPAAKSMLNVDLVPDLNWDDNIVSEPVYQPAEDFGLVTTAAIFYYNRLIAILSDETPNQEDFENKIELLDSDIIIDTLLTQAEKEALLCGTATAAASVDYWLANMDSWSEINNSEVSETRSYINTVTGKVLCGTCGESLSGVGVLKKGSSFYTLTDYNGEFRLSLVQPGDVLRFSLVGYETQDIKVNNKTYLTVALHEEGSTPVRFWDTTWGKVVKIAGNDAIGALGGACAGILTGGTLSVPLAVSTGVIASTHSAWDNL